MKNPLRFGGAVTVIAWVAASAWLAAGAAWADAGAGEGSGDEPASPATVPAKAADRTAGGAEPPIDRSLLLSYLADNGTFTLIDARSEQEYAVGHILGAVNVPHDAVEEAAAALPHDADAPLVVYCKTGKRASLVADQLSARGYTNVRVLGPGQIFWSDTAPMFNCGVPAQPDSPSTTPAGAATTPVTQPMITAEN